MAEEKDAGKQQHAAIDRLRDRTDELELIISSLTIFALLSIPGWLFDKLGNVYTHLSTSLVIASALSMPLLAGVCYALAACFVLHLMTRAYWVGLIGLRTVFPDGIDWSKTPGLGPLTRRYYREMLPDLDTAIEKTDRVASSLFAIISMLTLGVLWFGAILVAVLVLSGMIGARFGLTNTGMGIGALLLVIVFFGVPVLLYLLDAQLASRVTRLRENRVFGGIVRFLRRIVGLSYPQRLVLPVQLTLQSNTRPVAFLFALTLSVFAIVFIGTTRDAAWRNFTLSNEFAYLGSADVQEGFRSTYYEDMPSSLDRLRSWPRIDSFNQSGSFVRLFLPYHPLRDNMVLEDLCGRADENTDRVGCLRKLWTVSIGDTPVSISDFQAAERADLGMRGLIGLVPLQGLEPGLHQVVVVWNPGASEEDVPIDDRYAQMSFRYAIPFAFAPGYELSLE